MRRAFDFLTKLILTLALIVAALPLSASALDCAQNPPPPDGRVRQEEERKDRSAEVAWRSDSRGEGRGVRGNPPCAMACCVGKAKPMAHCAEPQVGVASPQKRIMALPLGKGRGVVSEKSVAASACACELAPGPALPAALAKSLPILSFVWNEDHPLRAVTIAEPALLRQPSLFGLDAEPPPDPPDRSTASRAPPVVRA